MRKLRVKKIIISILLAVMVFTTTITTTGITASAATTTTVATTEAQFVQQLTNAMINRETSFKINYVGDGQTLVSNMAVLTKDVVDSDDYLHYSMKSYNYNIAGTYANLDVTFTCAYHTTRAEEDYVDQKIPQIIAQVIKSDMTEKQKVRAINDYIEANVTYDYTLVKRSAYTALAEGKAVCQGYSLLMYRLLNQIGIPVRIVTGTLDGGSHSWNLVKVDGYWYQIDATNNDANSVNILYMVTDSFLKNKSINNFATYVWDTTQFPQAVTTYVPDGPYVPGQDITPPVITIGIYNTNPTNQDVVVTVTTNEGTLNTTSHTFTSNGSFDFIATDSAGNVTTKTVTITNIDKTAPTITVGAYNTNPTNHSITVTATTNEGTLNATSHTFTSNSSFDFVATDLAGNITTKTVTISNIIASAPIITIGNYIKTTTNQDITVTATTDKGTLNATSHTFTSNGSFDFVATDNSTGLTTTQTVTITNIDKSTPVITVGAYDSGPTNQDITVTATTNKGILNATSHTFTSNGSFDFVATDGAGNTIRKTVSITNIDKTAPIITVGNYTKTQTTQDIIVTVTTNEGTLNSTSHTFTSNGSFDFIATDEAGNVTTKTVTISNIVAPTPTPVVSATPTPTPAASATPTPTPVASATPTPTPVTSATPTPMPVTSTTPTPTPVVSATPTPTPVASVTPTSTPVITIGNYTTTPTNKDITVNATSNKGTLNATSHTFTQNGSFDFIVTDEFGNKTTKTVIITNIDKSAPIITIGYYTTTSTSYNITVTASSNEGMLNTTSHTFTQNGTFDFIATDLAGNVTVKAVTITNILSNVTPTPTPTPTPINSSTDITKASNSVLKAETTSTASTILEAQKLINTMVSSAEKEKLQERLDVVIEEVTDVAKDKVKNANKNKTAKNVIVAQKAIDNMIDSKVKENLQYQLTVITTKIRNIATKSIHQADQYTTVSNVKKAQKAINNVTDKKLKAKLQKQLNKIKSKLKK